MILALVALQLNSAQKLFTRRPENVMVKPLRAVCHSHLFAVVVAVAACTQNPGETTNPTDNTPQGNEPVATTPVQQGNTPVGPASPNNTTLTPIVTQPNQPVINPDPVVAPPAVPQPNVRVMGRTLPDDGNGPILNWPGTQVYAGFTGTSIRATLKELTKHNYGNLGRVNNHYNVSIDGGAPVHLPALQDGTQTVTLASGLAPGAHQMVLTKRTEGQVGSTQLLGFTLSSNATLAPATAPKTRRVEFIGDSGTVGYGADGNDRGGDVCAFTVATENAAQSYAMLTGKALAADVHITGNAGKGIYQNRDPQGDPVNTLPTMFTWANADSLLDFGTWNPNDWLADAVVVVVGGNDFAASTPSAQAYAQVANAFVKTLRRAYPNAWLFVTISPLLSATTEVVGRKYAQAMVAAAQDAKVAYIDVPTDDGSRNYGCDYHLSPASNAYYAGLYAAAIGAKLGWTPTPL